MNTNLINHIKIKTTAMMLAASVFACQEELVPLENEHALQETVTEVGNTARITPGYTFEEPIVTGNTYYIDPVNGSQNGDGSFQKPWKTLQEVVTEGQIQYYKHAETSNPSSPLILATPNGVVKGGDRIFLRSGYHGHLNLTNFMFKKWITIAAQRGHNPVLSQISLRGAFQKVYFKEITVDKSSYQGEGNYWEANPINRSTKNVVNLQTIGFYGKGSEVKLNGLKVITTENTQGWDASEWRTKAATGIGVRSVSHVEIYNCAIKNVRSGILLGYYSNHAKAVKNTVNNYITDGARIIGNDMFFAYNTIKGCLNVGDGNHDDAIQSYSRGQDNKPGQGIIKNVVIRGNLIVGNDPGHPLAGNPQGLGCFDGFFENWTVDNNVIVTNHYNGITFLGIRNSKIVNNTIVDQIDGDKLSPWIRIGKHKNSQPSSNVQVVNNIVGRSINIEASQATERNNYIIGHSNFANMSRIFANIQQGDARLKGGTITFGKLVDQGYYNRSWHATNFDIKGKNRNRMPDLGAHERQ